MHEDQVTSRRVAPAFAALLVAALLGCSGSPVGAYHDDSNTDPLQTQLVTADIQRFWHAYDDGGREGSVAAFQTHYIDSASTGLRDFIALRSVTAIRLADMMRAYPRYFAAIRANMLRLGSGENRTAMLAGFQRIKAMYPNAVFPPVTFLVGRFSTGGTTSSNGMLIGGEFVSRDTNTPVDELPPFQRNNSHSIDNVTFIVAHEHVHILQARAGGILSHGTKTLLDQSLMEGSADFIGTLVSGGNINARVYSYGLAHEAALWTEFKAAMNGTNVTNWLYNQGDATGERPGDLGYFVGYRIAEAYYNESIDKSAAIRDIIEMSNGTQFLQRSGYAP
jgi:hypothetical protein